MYFFENFLSENSCKYAKFKIESKMENLTLKNYSILSNSRK